MRPMRHLDMLAVLLVVSVAAAGAAPATSPNAETATAPATAGDPAQPSLATTANVVSIDVPVNVVDRDGHAMRGLTAADFTVYDENRKQALSGFEVVDLQKRAAAAAAPAAADVAPLPSEARRRVLLLFDLSFSSPPALLKARLAARDFVLHSLRDQDLAAVATYSLQQGPRLVVTFTTDRAQIARGIDTLGLRTPDNAYLDKNDPLRFIVTPWAIDSMDTTLANEGTGTGTLLRSQNEAILREYMEALTLVAEREERHYDESRIVSYADGLRNLARELAAVPGRKQVVLFSEGFDSRLLLGNAPSSIEAQENAESSMFGELWKVDSDTNYGSTRLQGDLFKMLDAFRRADCAVQAIDIGGLRADVKSSNGRTPASGEEALFYIANETGGALFRNANDLGTQLGAAMERTEVTYLLTFERGDLATDGKWHRLKVEVKNLPTGARVSYRPGYFGPRPFKDLDPMEKSLLAGDGVASAVPKRDVVVHVLAAPFRQGGAEAYVPVVLEIDGKSLLAGHSEKNLDAEIYAYASNQKGEMKDFFAQRLRVDLAKNKSLLTTAGVKYYGHLDLPPGEYQVRVLVRDGETGRTGVESIPLTVPTFAAAQPFLLPPLFIAGQPGWMMIREHGGDANAENVVYPFTVKGDPYVPAAHPVLGPSDRARLCLVGYNLGSDVAVIGHVVSRDGTPLAGGKVSLVERTPTGMPGVDKMIATFDPTGLAAGDYVLQVAVKDTASGTEQTSSQPFTLR